MNKKKTVYIFALILVLLLIVGCKPNLSKTESNTVTIVLSANFEGGEDKKVTVDKNANITLPAIRTIWQRDGYSFEGWSASKTSDDISYVDKATFTAFFDQTLYAVWKKIINVSYDANGGKGKIETQSFKYGDSISLADGNILKNGEYVFACWNTKADGSGENIEIESEYSDIFDLTLYAQWIKCGSALKIEIGEYDYQHYAYVSDCNESVTKISIPKYYKGYKVTKIGAKAFSDCESMTSCMIPNTITSIETEAFMNCSKLETIDLPDNLLGIGSLAFWGCTSLKSVSIPESVTSIGNSAFYGCENLDNVVIPDSVVNLGSFIFSNCTNLINISLNKNIKCIPSSMFSNCKKLSSIVIPDGVTSLGDCVFYECTSLVNISLPDSVTDVGKAVFYKCSSLKNVTLSNNIESIPAIDNGGIGFFRGCSNLTSIVLPANLITINDFAFMECKNLKSVIVGNKVASIGSYAFYDCNLEEINIPISVTTIKDHAIYGDNVTISYNSTIENWNKITLDSSWEYTSNCTVKCSDGVINL